MPKLVKDGTPAEDIWQLLADVDDALPSGSVIVPGDYWLNNQAACQQHDALGIWLHGDAELEPYSEAISSFPVIAIHFPAFMDGRGFSAGRLIRERYGFTGELRAVGNFIRDQLTYLRRCGFNAFSFPDDVDVEAAAKSLNDFSEYYQAAVDEPLPLFRRRQ